VFIGDSNKNKLTFKRMSPIRKSSYFFTVDNIAYFAENMPFIKVKNNFKILNATVEDKIIGPFYLSHINIIEFFDKELILPCIDLDSYTLNV
jgi:hypothetical protein